MAIRVVQNKKLDSVIIVSQHDDAIDHEKVDWDSYTEDYDMAKLKFLPEKQPTKFVCNFKFNAEEAADIKNSMMSSLNKRDKTPNLTIGSYQQNVVRFGLKDVQNPEDVPVHERLTIKKQGKYVRDDSLAMLEQLGLVDEIFTAYNTLTTANATTGNEKN